MSWLLGHEAYELKEEEEGRSSAHHHYIIWCRSQVALYNFPLEVARLEILGNWAP